MDYIDAATMGTVSAHILPIMLSHIEDTVPSTLHLPVSSEDTLHFYCYLCTHVLIGNKQFLLLIDVPIQDWILSTKFSHWIFHMVIILPAIMSTLNILGLHKMKPWQWKFCHNSGFVKKQMDSFVQSLHHFNHLQAHPLALLLYMSKIQPAFQPDILYRSGNLQMLVCPHKLPPMFGY